MVRVKWNTCSNGGEHWCNLMTLDLSSIKQGDGVYIIWHEGSPGQYVYVGQGNIRKRLASHRKDKRITAYENKKLRVTWAFVSAAQLDGVESYLSDKCRPLIGDVYPKGPSIAVNLPS
ncbi:MAG: GIY-YIG nuclease family protein [Nitrospinae bacterium]|nr:GIY-YIG nuclease family protein [Nitrospinota bacterium]